MTENEPPTGYEPNEHHIKEAYEHFTQESSVEQRFPNDFDYDDGTIGKALLDTCKEEDLSSSLSLSSVSHDRTERRLLLHLTHKFRVFKKFRDTVQKMSKSGFFWNDKESRCSLTVKQRLEHTNSRRILTGGAFKS